MGLSILWVELLAICLLSVAAGLAAVPISKRPRRYPNLEMLTVLLAPVFFLGLPAILTAIGSFYNPTLRHWFGYIGSLSLFGIMGSLLIYKSARRRKVPDGPIAAATWPHGRLSFALVLTIGLSLLTIWNMDLAARTQVAMLRAEAGTISLALAPPLVPNSRNAALVYAQAFQRLKADNSWHGEGPEAENHPFNQDKPDIHDPAVTALLTRHAPTLALLKRAAARPDCYFECDYAHPTIDLFDKLRPELKEVMTSSQLLQLHARQELSQGHTEAAMDDVQTLFHLAEHIGQVPLLIPALMAIAIDLRAVQILEEALPTVSSAQQLASLALPDTDGLARIFRRALRGDETCVLGTYTDLMMGKIDPGFFDEKSKHSLFDDFLLEKIHLKSIAYVGARFWFLSEEVKPYRHFMQICQEASTQPYYQIKTKLDESDAIFSTQPGVFLRLFTSSLPKCFVWFTKVQASLEMAQVAIAAKRYQLDQGRLPVKLEELVPTYLPVVPLDPFGGKPLRMTAKAEEIVLYSVGPDGKNNGETKGDKTQDQQNQYLTFRLRLAPKK